LTAVPQRSRTLGSRSYPQAWHEVVYSLQELPTFIQYQRLQQGYIWGKVKAVEPCNTYQRSKRAQRWLTVLERDNVGATFDHSAKPYPVSALNKG
jgi:hypothetical protein